MACSRSYEKFIEEKIKNLSDKEFYQIKHPIVALILQTYNNIKHGIEDDYLSIYHVVAADFKNQQELLDYLNLPREVWEKFIVTFIQCEIDIKQILLKYAHSKEPKKKVLKTVGLNLEAFNLPDLCVVP